LRKLQMWSDESIKAEYLRFVREPESPADDVAFLEGFRTEIAYPSPLASWLWRGTRCGHLCGWVAVFVLLVWES
jgi:hypothetical protein